MAKRIFWGYPVKSLEKAQKRLEDDLKFFGGDGQGNCAKLDERNPKVVARTFKDGSIIHVDKDVFDSVNEGDSVYKKPWSKHLRVGNKEIYLNWSLDSRRMILVMPITVFVLTVLGVNSIGKGKKLQ